MAFQPSTHRPWAFLGLTFALSVPLLLVSQLLGNRLPGGLPLPISALGAFLPAVSAALLVQRQSGRAGLRAFFRQAVDAAKIQDKRWLLPVLLIHPAIMLLSYGVMRLAGLPLPEPVIAWASVPVLFGVFFLSAAGEELGWQGYAYEPLEQRWGAWKAALILGLAWAAFHLIPDLQNRQPLGWIFWQRLGTILNRILIVWFYRKTGRSVLAAILVHDLLNVSWILFPNRGSHYNPRITTLVTGLVLALLYAWQIKPAKNRKPAGRKHPAG